MSARFLHPFHPPVSHEPGQSAEPLAMRVVMQRSMPASSRLHSEAIQFRLILAATYPFFLVAALVQRLLPSGSAPRPGLPRVRRSVFGEAKAMAVSAIPFAFMG